ncbi:MAG: DUF7453 family protein [Candidatus Rokuibacteriota bacterium]
MLLVAVGCATPGDARHAEFEIRPVVGAGEAAPSGDAFAGFGALQLNAAGDLLFEARLALGGGAFRGGLFIVRGDRIDAVAVQGEPTPIGGRYLGFSYGVLNDRREIAFVAMIERAGNDRPGPLLAIFRTGQGISPVAIAQQEPAPVEGRFTAFSDLALGGGGSLAFVATLDHADAPAALFVSDAGVITRLAAVLDPTPAGGHFREVSTPSIGRAGAVAFHGAISGARPRAGIFLASREAIRSLVLTGDATPLGGTFGRLANPVLGRDGTLYFWGQIDGGRAPSAIFVRREWGELHPLAIRGAPSPSGRPFSFLGIEFTVADALAFEADLDETPATSAIFLAAGATVQPVVRSGRPATGGHLFTEFGGFAVGAHDELAFVGVAGGRTAIYRARPRRR